MIHKFAASSTARFETTVRFTGDILFTCVVLLQGPTITEVTDGMDVSNMQVV